MKKIYFITLVFPFILLNCLKAKRSPFDVSKPSPGLVGTITAIMNGSFSSTSPNATTSPTSTTTTPSSLLPSVTSTSPADASTGITANIPVIITFNMTMDKTSITTNSDDTTCSGSVQISFDNFVTCVKMRSSITTTDNKTFTLTANPTMGTFATHKIKVTTNAKSDVSVKLATDYSHATGFTTSTPCTVYDAATCPIPFSTAATMTFSMSAGALVIPIVSGAAKGKILVTEGSSGSGTLTTNVFNPDTGIFSTGPNLTALHGGSSNQTFYFNIISGIHSGKVLINHGDPSGLSTNTTSIYDPIANTMIIGPNLTTTMGTFVNAFTIASGVNSGKTMVLLNSGTTTNLYDPLTNSFSIGPALSLPLWNNAHSITISSGANSGKTLIIHSGNTPDVSVYDPVSGTFTTGPNLTPSPNYGAHSFVIPSGSQAGNILTMVGSTSGINSILINSTNLTASAGANLPNSINPTSSVSTHSVAISQGIHSGKIWLIHGSNSTTVPSDSSFYDSTSNTFSAGPTMITQATSSSKTVFIESGIYANKYMTFYGGKYFTSLYDPIKNAIDPSSILPSAAGGGINKVLLTTGSNAGKMLIINGGSNATSIFDFASGTFSSGATLTGVMGRSPGIFTISGGSQDGKTLVVHGGGLTTTSLYDPSSNTFSAGPALSAAANNIISECIFKVPSGAQAGKYLIIHGNVSQSTSLYDPSNNTIAAGPITGAIIGLGATCFPIISGTHSGKFLVVQGFAGTGTRMYDPATNTFGAGPALTMNTTNGTFSMPITNGANNGKTLIIVGTGTTTNLYDPMTHTFSIGPNLSGSASSISPSSYLLLTNGTNKDKYLVMHDTTSSIYDPNTNTVSAGLALPNGGSLAFNINSGLFNQGVLLITGSGNLTNVVYP